MATNRLTLVLAVAMLVAPAVTLAPSAQGEEQIETWRTTVTSFDDHEIPVKIYKAPGANQTAQPTLLWGHGWSGSIADSDDDGQFFAENGYNVVAMDFRGHGDARQDSQARVHDPDFEIRDVTHVIDFIEGEQWAETDSSGDPVLGALGGSYGGGYQLLTAAQDDRLDAIAPEITWHDLPQALGPNGNAAFGDAFPTNGAVKSAWVDVLYGAGTARANLHPFIHQSYAWAMSTNEFPSGDVPGEPDALDRFKDSSPKSHGDQIDVPALLIQGVPDTLFNLNQAVANHEMIEAAGGDATLTTHLGGHIISTDGTVPIPTPVPVGIQPGARDGGCDAGNDRILAFYDKHLKGQTVDVGPEVEIALDDGTCQTFSSISDLEPSQHVDAAGPIVLPQGTPGATDRVTLLPASSTPATVAGIPTLEATATVAGADAIVYLSLVATDGLNERVLDAQITPLRLSGPAEEVPVTVDLAGVGTSLTDDEALVLELSTSSDQFATNGERLPGAIVLEDLRVGLPVAS